jgi:anti-sigma B factor antagonist
VAISIEELPGGITKVILDGSLDIAGAAAIDLRMNLVGGTAKAMLVDMQQVTFLGSMGLRSFIAPARALGSRGGKMVIFGPTQMVEQVLTTSGIDTIIPIYHDLDAAVAALQAGA